MFFFLIFFLVPAVVIAALIMLSTRKSEKPWLKPFFSHHDFHKELFSFSSIGILAVTWSSLYNIIDRNTDFTGSAFVEIWILLFGLISFGVALLVKSYWTLTFSYIFGVIYIIVEMVKWSYDKSFYWISTDLSLFDYISPLAILGLVWLLINFSYFLGKFYSKTKILGRFGNLIRSTAIASNLVILGFLSSSYLLKQNIANVFSGKLVFCSYPLVIVIVVLAALTAFSIYKRKLLGLSLEEIMLSILPGWLLVILSLLFVGRFNFEASLSGDFNPGSIFWNIIFTVLYLSYAMYLVYKGYKNNEKWLRYFSLTLLVLALIAKFIDTSINLGFNGIFLSIFGLLVMGVGIGIETVRRKNIAK